MEAKELEDWIARGGGWSTTMNNNSQEFTTPGEKLGLLTQYLPGPGTHPWHDHVVASVVGLQHIVPPPPHAPDQVRNNIFISSIFQFYCLLMIAPYWVCNLASPPIPVDLLKTAPTLHSQNPNCHFPNLVLTYGLRPQKPLRMRWPNPAIQVSSHSVHFTKSFDFTYFDQK